jgi:hypothetical protein
MPCVCVCARARACVRACVYLGMRTEERGVLRRAASSRPSRGQSSVAVGRGAERKQGNRRQGRRGKRGREAECGQRMRGRVRRGGASKVSRRGDALFLSIWRSEREIQSWGAYAVPERRS